MSTAIFDAFSKCEEALLTHLKISGTEVDDYHDWPWRNYVFESGFYRRAHLDAAVSYTHLTLPTICSV